MPCSRISVAVAAQVLLVRDAEALDLERLLPVRAHHTDARQRFLRDRADVRQLLLNAIEAAMNRGTEVADRQRHERQRHQRDCRQPGIDGEHQHDRDDERQPGRGGVHHRRPDEHADGAQIVRGARHQVAGPIALEVVGVEPLQMREEVVAQVVLEAARRADDDAAHEKAEDAADRGQREQRGRVPHGLVDRDAGGEVVDGVLEHPRAGQRDGRGQDGADESEEERATMRGEIAQQAPCAKSVTNSVSNRC